MRLAKFFTKKKPQRHYQDVRAEPKKKLFGRFRLPASGRVVDLAPTFYERYQFWVILAVIILGASFFIWKKVLTRAEAVDFYPTTCLGTWQNPQNAQGKPETFNTQNLVFTDENSATSNGSSSEIYCGSFIPPDYEAQGDIKNVGLTLVWQIGEATSPSSTLQASPDASSSSFFFNPHRLPFSGFIERALADEIASDSVSTQSNPDIIPSPPAPPPPSIEPQTPPESSSTSESVSSTPTISAPENPPAAASETPVAEPAASSAPSAESASTSDVISEVPPPPPDENFLKVSYSTDGQTWAELAKVNPDNWRNFTQTVPVQNWSELAKLQIKVEGISTSLQKIPPVYLDGILLEVHYDLPPIIAPLIALTSESQDSKASTTSVIVLPPDKKPQPVQEGGSFNANEAPAFELDLGNFPAPSGAATSSGPLPETPAPASPTDASSTSGISPRQFSLANFFLEFLGFHNKAKAEAAPITPTEANPVVASVVGPDGKPTDLHPAFLTVNGRLRISFSEPGSRFMPGLYHLKLWIWQNNAIYFTENDFTWGVLAVNFNKSIYALGDIAHIGLGVLTNQGHTVCEAKISLLITAPSGRTFSMTTENGMVIRNKTCGPQTVTNEPDYNASLLTRETGSYNVTVAATTNEGTRKTQDKFEVQDPPVFDVERLAPTRIYPPATYGMEIRIKANQDFAGNVTESLPTDFSAVSELQTQRSFAGETQTISWPVNLKKGSSTMLAYSFNAPDISPALFKMGPLQIGSWQEARQWQLASDAAGEIILLWDGTSSTVPTGWTCISCAASDPFNGVYPRASSTYGSASSSANTASHSATLASVGAESAASAKTEAAGSTYPLSTHTHASTTFTTSANDIRPSSTVLLFIKASTTTIPNGTIGMFDVASTSLPANWSYYSAMNGNYLAGAVNTSTITSTGTHVHTTGAQTSGAANNAGGNATSSTATVADASHTHSLADTSLVATSSDPLFVTMVFGKHTTTSTLGSSDNGLIAFFDNTSLPTSWAIFSTSSNPTSNRLIKGSDTYGTQGGRLFHTHDNLSITSGGPSATVVTGRNSQTTLAGSAHTHSFTWSFATSTENSMPINRYGILGKYTFVNSAPTVSAVVYSTSSITLTANATTSINVVASTTDPDGAGDISFATGTIYRTAVSGGAGCTADNLNCYQLASSSCTFSGSTSTVTCSAKIYYFAQATDASSSFSSDTWSAKITLTDSANATNSSSTVSTVELNTLLAIDVTPTTTSYGTVKPNNNTGATNQTSSVKNAGNSSTTLQLRGTALTLSGNNLATSSQRYATSSFTFGAGDQTLSDTDTAVSGFTLTSPTSTNAVSSLIYWGVSVATGYATGTYSGTNTFTAIFSP